HLLALFPEEARPPRSAVRNALQELREDSLSRGVELMEVASGWRFQVKAEFAPWVSKLWQKRPPRYSRALLETLALIAYRQPITRAEIESIRGVSVSTNILRTLQEYEWIRVLAHRDSPGRPALYGTTRAFLDHFNLKHLSELPSLTQLLAMQDLPNELLSDEETFDVEEDETSTD
ncbi:MAG: SMC-Scp complex subunit ScpB, partial [Pseudomonadota bacterium]